MVSGEWFSASTTFDATLGSSVQPVWGAGLEIDTRKNVFIDLAWSRMSRTGQRAFAADTGQVFRLAIALHAALMPVELTVGKRFPLKPRVRTHRVTPIPYVGVGVGIYHYAESSDFSTSSEDVAATHAGFLVLGGAEFRLSRWAAVTADAQYTRVPGILGQGGISQQLDEHDLGGVAGRVRVILGR